MNYLNIYHYIQGKVKEQDTISMINLEVDSNSMDFEPRLDFKWAIYNKI